MILNGIRCRRSKVYGWRNGDPATDVDRHGDPVQSNYMVIVRIKDCPVVDERHYNPKGVKQAFPISNGGTYYGYGESQIVRHGRGRYVRVYRGDPSAAGTNSCGKSVVRQDLLFSYAKTPVYFVQDGRVYVGACYRELKAGEAA
jgi:hypothetical protein